MDALKALAGEHGCSVDGTAAQRNPLSSFVNQGMGGPQHQHQGMRHGQQGAHGRGMSDIDRGMSAGMGVMAGPRGPIMAGPGAAPSFAQEFEQMRAGGPPPGPMMNGPRAHGPRGGDQWINDFERMKLGGGMPQRNIQMEAAFRENLRRQQGPRPMGQRWAGQMAARPPPSHMDHAWKQTARPPEPAQQWAQEMAGPTEAPDAEKWAQEASAEPKTEPNMDQAWKESAPAEMNAAWEESAMGKMEMAFQKAWEDAQNGNEVNFEELYKNALSEAGEGDFANAWDEGVESSMGKVWSETQTANLADRPYELAAENPFATDDNPYERGIELFKQGQLPDAILAFEAAVTKDGTHADAWRMLGVAHQENDQDPKAISCLERAVENDAYHLDALLGLGVSYVNELDQEKALKNLKAWVVNNPNFHGLEVSHDPYGDGSLMDDVMQLMLKAAEWAPNDADVQEVLGVLYNVSRDYNSAVVSFKKALSTKPDDYSLWNKLGATLANGQRSDEALPSYHRALELKPRYARGWLNLGISHSNLGNYKEAARCYLKALDLNPEAVHIWSYLRICFTCMERFDLIAASDKRDLDAFRAEFNF
uniref:Peroxin-5 n=1 Tax=Mucochytrium quahogii TaxID=96639 RepID=A0A7S2SJ13_9STRA|mmetsp:Transcript_3574/g.5169  ORF Transcript_3574/g.5169 Transcript_3574/m.5169 type:complete len:592 (+) Transcript_3574:171-1946(+)|eukprot:CAMPEP_0203769950 /NCGR_PEP_ID=MMETSP0099_2-20121227/2505_1 /ASSEMBLY_ACC=CAM_ASM_000209 /TAXON_ID=96639 /ORGANISM=" , Strain NY0313808BC1" /LENGTH=591 /DNA_ID=CAMNT_0050666963 /DNA_START=156 /DNA_END=1931 /DNA_ORIENTATION=-